MGKKILLADDSITIQKVIELTFSDEDFDVVTVGNGRLALEKIQEIRPDIVLCDIIMPEKDGYEVCEFIKKSPSLQSIPVLLLTGAFEPFDQERAARVGSDGFLAKPFEPETLIAKVKELLSRAGGRAAQSTPPLRPAPVPAAIPFVAPNREPERPQAPPPLTVVPPRPPDPIPFPRAATAAPEPVAPPPSVSFIPDEPFEDLDGASFSTEEERVTPSPASAPAAAFRSAAEELLPMTPEESESLGVPDSASTVMFKAGAVSWQTPAPPAPVSAPPSAPVAEVVLEAAEPEAEATVFEEVIEEDVEFGSGYPSPTYQAPPRVLLETPSASFRPATFEPVPPAAQTVEVPPVPKSVPPIPAAPTAPPPSAPPVAVAPSAPAPSNPPTHPDIVEPTATVAMAPPWLAIPGPAPEPEPDEALVPTPARSFAPALTPPPPAAPVAPAAEPPAPVAESFADLVPDAPPFALPAKAPSEAAEVAVPVEMVEKIAQRVVAQISEKIVREIAWDVIPDLAEQLIKSEIERLKAELQRI